MFDIKMFQGLSEVEKYENMILMLGGLIEDEADTITQLCNASALINAFVERINWCGFYIIKNGELVLGPFQGMPACTRIKLDKGVCGKAATEKCIIRVDNVHNFQGHIGCDAASNSEIVLPIIKDGTVYGVLDIDSEEFSRFGDIEEKYLKTAVEIIVRYIDFSKVS